MGRVYLALSSLRIRVTLSTMMVGREQDMSGILLRDPYTHVARL